MAEHNIQQLNRFKIERGKHNTVSPKKNAEGFHQ